MYVHVTHLLCDPRVGCFLPAPDPVDSLPEGMKYVSPAPHCLGDRVVHFSDDLSSFCLDLLSVLHFSPLPALL